MAGLTRIYTRSGDGGRTGLADGRRVAKSGRRVAALGELDELNAHLGLARAWVEEESANALLLELQRRLFELGAELAGSGRTRIDDSMVEAVERAIDHRQAALEPLRHFLLPGGGVPAAQLHLARAVCRRAERALWRLAEKEAVNPSALKYLNRLSDLLFVLARSAAAEETPWRPAT